MKKIILPLLALSLISGCAYYQGMQEDKKQTEETTKKHAIHVPPSPKPIYNSNQNSPANVSAKMISPLTQ